MSGGVGWVGGSRNWLWRLVAEPAVLLDGSRHQRAGGVDSAAEQSTHLCCLHGLWKAEATGKMIWYDDSANFSTWERAWTCIWAFGNGVVLVRIENVTLQTALFWYLVNLVFGHLAMWVVLA